jgi:murein L,D-transpeptidase YcbB/YkuD
VVILALVASSGAARGQGPVAPDSLPPPVLGTVAAEIKLVVSGSPTQVELHDSPETRRLWKLERRVYAERGYRPVWCDEDGGFPAAPALLAAVRDAADHGLDPAGYPVDKIQKLAQIGSGADVKLRAEVDVTLSTLFLTYAAHLSRGRLNPYDLPVSWYLPRRKVDLAAALEDVAATGRADRVLDRIEPNRREYVGLRRALDEMLAAGTATWPRVTGTFRAERGDTLEGLVAVRRYLAAVGDLPSGPALDPRVMDDVLALGVLRFQRRHGLIEDGVIGPKTLAQMKVPRAARVRTLLVNLERWRWLPDTLASRAVIVNVPSYDLKVVDGEKTVLAMRVIAGTRGDPTPNFADAISHMELNPQWHVPESIATEEILPKVKADPNYLIAENISVVDSTGQEVDPTTVPWEEVNAESMAYRFRQEPGGGNPLGSIKFLFPNRFSVYLHDTPNSRLFEKDERAMSHGCVRIEHPLDLAAYLLGREGRWTRKELEDEVKSGKRKWIDLKETTPIYILYFTAFVDRDGKCDYRPDIYNRDASVDSALTVYRSPYLAPEPPVAGLEGASPSGER